MRTVVMLLVLLAGCGPQYYPTGSFSSGPPATVWVSKIIGVGRACVETDRDIPRPDARKMLSAEGIIVYDYAVRERAVCLACYMCPASSASHYLKIDAENEEQAKTLGFELSSPPPPL